MKALRCFSSCLSKQCNEAVRITESKAEIVMNSKSEWHQAPIVRVIPTAGLLADQGELPAVVPVRGRGARWRARSGALLVRDRGRGSRRPGGGGGGGWALTTGDRTVCTTCLGVISLFAS